MADGFDHLAELEVRVSMGAFIVRIGDWIAFPQNGTVVYGRVGYIVRRRVMGSWDVVTSAGTVAAESVLEIRRAATFGVGATGGR